MQDNKNRQNSISIDDFYNGPNDWLRAEWQDNLGDLVDKTKTIYTEFRDMGVAKEVARVMLPEGLTMSTMYVNGTLRSWLHYLDVREDQTTQKEHRELASKIREVLTPVFPVVMGLKSNGTF